MHHKFETLHQSLLHGKLPRSLHWSDVLELIGHLGQIHAHGGDEFTFSVGAQREVFRRPHTPEVGVEEAARLRRFLREAAAASAPNSLPLPGRMIVIIDHHTAEIFRDLDPKTPQEAVSITPYDPHDFHHHLIHRKEAHYEGDRVPEQTSFYDEIAAALATATEIVLIGNATGKSSAVSVLQHYLNEHRSDISRRVKATEILDLSALTRPEIEAIARKHLIAAV